MSEVPFHLKYVLGRRQRLALHLNNWLPLLACTIALAATVSYFVVGKWWLLLLLPLSFVVFPKFWLGILDVVFRGKREMDVMVDQNGIGFLRRGQRLWLFLDGISAVKRCGSTWKISHHNGQTINIPADVITERQIGFIRQAIPNGKQAENVHPVIAPVAKLQPQR